MKTPKLTDVDKTKQKLISLDLLQEVWDMETGRDIYRMTLLGRQLLDYVSLRLSNTVFGWELSPYAPKGDSDTWEDARLICVRENILSDDETMLTTEGVQIIFGLIHLKQKPLIKSSGTKGQSDDKMAKFGTYMFKFMKMMNSLSKSAQKYDTATSNLGKEPKQKTPKRGAQKKAKPETDPFGWDKWSKNKGDNPW